MLKNFCILFQFRGDIQMCKNLHGVIDTAESDTVVLTLRSSAVSLTTQMLMFSATYQNSFYNL